MSLLNELKRRNVFRVAAAYVVIAWLLIQVLGIAADSFEAPVWVMKMIITGVVIGFIPAVLFSWAFELTPEGIKKEKGIASDDSVTNITAKKLDYITLAAAVGVLGLFGWQQMNPVSRLAPITVESTESLTELVDTQTKPVSLLPVNAINTALTLGVAVLPFANLSEDPNNAFFAGGVHEDVLTQLSYIRKLRVISRTSMMKVAELGMEVREIGKHLGVSHVLEGSVRRAGDQVRVTVQLIDATTDEHVWADNFDRKLDDIFTIQSEIAEKIAAQLKAELTPEEIVQIEQVPTNSNEAYDLYLKARDLERVWRGADTFKDMLPLLEKAIALDSDYLKARVKLVEVYGRLVWTGSDPSGEYRVKAKETLDYILANYPDSVDAFRAQSNYLYTVNRDYVGALKWMKKVLLVHPNDTGALLRAASCYKRLNNFTQGLPLIQKAASLDPEHAAIANELSIHFEGAGFIEQAYAIDKLNIIKFPDDASINNSLAAGELNFFGNLDRFIELMAKRSPQELYRSVYYEYTTTSENIDDIVKTIDEYKKDENDCEIAFIDSRVADLLNTVGREQESQKRAQLALDVFDKDDASFDNFIANRKKQFYASMANLACLANDQAVFKRFEGIMRSHKALEFNEGNLEYALAIAECGDIPRAWSMLYKDANAKGLRTVTPWNLALNPKYQRYFSELPEYQKMVADLQASKESKK